MSVALIRGTFIVQTNIGMLAISAYNVEEALDKLIDLAKGYGLNTHVIDNRS